MAKVSIIMSTYREYEKGELQRAIASVVRQTYSNWELIIIGDRAPCESGITSHLKTLQDTRIRFINLSKRAPGNVTHGIIPKIKGVEESTGEFIAFLDADNEYTPEHLERCVKALESDVTLDLVYENSIIKTTDSGYSFLTFTWKKPQWNHKTKKRIMRSNFLDTSEVVFIRNAYISSGGLEASTEPPDWLLWKKMIHAKCDHFKHLPYIGLIYYTTDLKHHILYFFLMIAQKLRLSYKSTSLDFIKRIRKRRLDRKHKL